MTQVNQSTKVKREVKRRPQPPLQCKLKDAKDLPSTWELMQPQERVRRVTLSPSSTEYQSVVALLGGKIKTPLVVKIERVQNPFLWRPLQNKGNEMATVLGQDVSKVDVRQLFHGTKPDIVAKICAENFDWRLHGSSTGQLYGRGTYFSTDAAYSYKYCVADGNGKKSMFVARVAVGTMTVGDDSMVRPPNNSATGMLFDSTVNQMPNPTIIVKYDKQEYYPEYIITLT